MKTSLLLIAALAGPLAVGAQQDNTQPPTQTGGAPQAAPVKAKKKKDRKPPVCSDLPPDQQVRFKLPPALQQALDRQRAEIERRTGITLPPPPPPKPLPPCPPATPANGAPAKQ